MNRPERRHCLVFKVFLNVPLRLVGTLWNGDGAGRKNFLKGTIKSKVSSFFRIDIKSVDALECVSL